VNELQKEQDNGGSVKKVINTAQEIVDTFVLQGSEYEVNISSEQVSNGEDDGGSDGGAIL